MNGPEHYAAAQNLLSDASFRSSQHGHPITRDGRLFMPGEHETLISRATAHALLALVAVNAQQLADRYVGDGPHINAWRDTWVAREPVEAVIYCGTKETDFECGRPDGHDGEHVDFSEPPF